MISVKNVIDVSIFGVQKFDDSLGVVGLAGTEHLQPCLNKIYNNLVKDVQNLEQFSREGTNEEFNF